MKRLIMLCCILILSLNTYANTNSTNTIIIDDEASYDVSITNINSITTDAINFNSDYVLTTPLYIRKGHINKNAVITKEIPIRINYAPHARDHPDNIIIEGNSTADCVNVNQISSTIELQFNNNYL